MNDKRRLVRTEWNLNCKHQTVGAWVQMDGSVMKLEE